MGLICLLLFRVHGARFCVKGTKLIEKVVLRRFSVFKVALIVIKIDLMISCWEIIWHSNPILRIRMNKDGNYDPLKKLLVKYNEAI